MNVDSGYTTPTLSHANDNNNKNINLMLGAVKPGKAERTKLTCTGTLQKVKRVYL